MGPARPTRHQALVHLLLDGMAASSQRTVLEFFSGIGGLHYALRRSGVPHRVLRAYDVDDSAVRTYRHNLPESKVITQNIVSLTSEDLRQLGADCWLLSPPCQPHTRQGLQLGDSDPRSSALTHVVNLLECGEAALLPDSLLLENVVGFESSSARRRLHAVLVQRGYQVRELWASPVHFGVPNQRTRYFLLASRVGELAAPPPAALAPLVLDPASLEAAGADDGERLPPPRGEVSAELQQACAPLSSYLLPAGSSDLEASAVADHVLERYGAAMDLLGRTSRRSLCFTKNYSRYVKGTGSILCEGLPEGASPPMVNDDKSLDVLQPLRPRFFAPREIANIHGFPADFSFPPVISRKKQFELLGNSLSVQVCICICMYICIYICICRCRRSLATASRSICAGTPTRTWTRLDSNLDPTRPDSTRTPLDSTRLGPHSTRLGST